MKLSNCPLLAVVLLTLLTAACGKMDETYRDFWSNGELIYPGKADSIQAHSGKNRLQLSWIVPADPNVVRAMIYWNNGQDSLSVDIQQRPGPDTAQVMLNNLEEKAYTFEVYTFDQKGNKSVRSEAIGTVYGDTYRSSLLNRAVRDISYSDNGQLQLVWEVADEGTVGEEISYRDNQGRQKQLFFDTEHDTIQLPAYDITQESIRISTSFLPDSSAIDTFMSPAQNLPIVIEKTEKHLDRSLFHLFPLPGDYTEANTTTSTIEKIWANDTTISESNTYISKIDGHTMPQWFTIDLGASYDLNRMKIYQRGDASATRLYAGGNLMEFEVWGSGGPEASYDPDQHNGDFGPDWRLLQHCNVVRPSGNSIPAGATRTDNTAADIAAATAGHEFSLQDATAIRYIRIKAIRNWDSANRAFINIASINFWAPQY